MATIRKERGVGVRWRIDVDDDELFLRKLGSRATAKKFECLRKQALPIGIGLLLIGLMAVAKRVHPVIR